MKKFLKYLQGQALQYSKDGYTSAVNLSPRGNIEPQHRWQCKVHGIGKSEGMSLDESPSNSTANCGLLSSSRLPFAKMKKVQYGQENILQNYEVYLTSDDEQKAEDQDQESTKSDLSRDIKSIKPKYWVIFIHGGYFRDPSVTSGSFYPALGRLINPKSESATIRQIQSHVEGYASINYRLAPDNDKYPQYLHSDDVPAYERRDAQWPDMMDDVLEALRHLQARYGFGQNYLLVGHSVGATMAMLAALKAREHVEEATQTQPPLAVVGVCGIYDFEALHAKFPSYEHLTRNAIKDETEWVRASPARYTREGYEKLWIGDGRTSLSKAARWVLLAQSKTDGLVDFAQAEEMYKVFDGTKNNEADADADSGLILSDLIEIEGKHNEVWKKGHELARVVAMGVAEMMNLGLTH